MTSQIVGTRAGRRFAVAGLGVALAAAAMAVTAAVTLNTHNAAGAGGGFGCISTTGPVCTFKSHVAFADFNTVSAFAGGGGGGDCVVTDAFVQPFESVQMPGKVASTSVFISLSTFNFCTEQNTECAGNSDPSTGAPLFNGTIQFGLDLTTARVTGTAPMFDPCTGASFTATVDVSWQAFGPTSTSIDSNHFRSPGFAVNSHFKGASRQAVASGTLTDAGGANRAASPTANADVENDSSGTVIQSRP